MGLIDRKVAVDDLKSKGPSQVWDTADVEVWVNALPSVQPEVTEEAVKEYCRKRCLCIVDSALLKKYAYAQPEITRCKECRFSEYDAMYNDRYCHHGGKAEVVGDEHYCGYGRRRPE